ncbi:MAG: glycosyltransferase family 39 protein [Planctomycetota bacterium]|nr:glycosyltransferase family 39 protein [Planctomycetota bacterium]
MRDSSLGAVPVGAWARWAGRAGSAAWFIVLVTAARLVYLFFFCPYSLIEDEAHYWEWSRRLALSYYTKGPGIAWAIRGATELFGDVEGAVRLPAVVCGAIAGAGVAMLAHGAIPDRRAAFIAAACFMLTPIFQITGLIVTIDGPLTAAWTIGAWGAWRALVRDDPRGWLVLGAAVGVGCLFKYTTLLLPLGVFAAANVTGLRVRRHVPAMLGGAALCAVGLLPVIVWNARNDWATIAHLLGHLGVKGGDMPVTQGRDGWSYSPLWTLSFLGTQAALLGPVLILGVLGALDAWRARTADPARWRREGALAAMGMPVFLFYFLVSFLTEPEGNWALAGGLTFVPLAAGRVLRGMDDWLARVRAWRASPSPRPRMGVLVRRPETPTQVLWMILLCGGLVVAVGSLRLDLLARLPRVGRYIPVHRFTGAERMAAHVDRLRAEVRDETGAEPFVVAMHYGRASQMAFYLPGHPVVYCATSVILGGRHTQYDYWPDTDLRRDLGLRGRPSVMLGGTREAWSLVFARVREIGRLDADGKKDRPVFIGEDFLFTSFDRNPAMGRDLTTNPKAGPAQGPSPDRVPEPVPEPLP